MGRLQSKIARNLNRLGSEAKEQALFAMLKKDIPLMTSTPQSEVPIIRKSGPLVLTPGDFIHRTGNHLFNALY